MIKLAVSGCRGRMGERITHLALADNAFEVTTLLEDPNHPKALEPVEGMAVSTDNDALAGCDVLIEFTLPGATIKNLEACLKHNVKMVIGTTGFTPAQIEKIKAASEKIPIVFASNMSVGVNIFFKLLEHLTTMLPSEYSARLIEAHHIHKKDAPSGTAKTLASIIEANSDHKMPHEEIHSIREGEIIGDHEIIFEGPEDVIAIKHHAKNRDIFAKGSLVAAKFLKDKPAGLFDMQKVLGI